MCWILKAFWPAANASSLQICGCVVTFRRKSQKYKIAAKDKKISPAQLLFPLAMSLLMQQIANNCFVCDGIHQRCSSLLLILCLRPYKPMHGFRTGYRRELRS